MSLQWDFRKNFTSQVTDTKRLTSHNRYAFFLTEETFNKRKQFIRLNSQIGVPAKTSSQYTVIAYPSGYN